MTRSIAAPRDLLFSVTRADCDWEFLRGSGKGGQNRNKVSTACRCTHRASGAVGYAEDTRSQVDNRRLAFQRMAATKAFQDWQRVEAARRMGVLTSAEEEVARQMAPRNLRIEGKDEHGRWSIDAIMEDTEQ